MTAHLTIQGPRSVLTIGPLGLVFLLACLVVLTALALHLWRTCS